jgi:S-disulfanyl-L-cysteine oxidoreductase SoxD
MRRIRFGPAAIRFAFGVAITAYALVGVFSMTGHAGQARPVTAGVYSAAQATRGKDLYTAQCLPCHGEMLEGVVGPPLTGNDFLNDFAGLAASDVVDKIVATMPQQAPGTLTRPQAIDLTAYILQVNKFPAGPDLTAATLPQATFPGAKAAAATANAGGLPVVVVANLRQLMIGVTFPNANIIFNTQLKDPADDKGKPPVPFDYVLWGSTAYHGWQQVDHAAMALQETAALFLVPGRKCQNGRPVPVDKPDFIKFTHDLQDFAKEVQKVALTRDVEKVSAMSEKLNDVCANCHKVYRDVAPPGVAASSSLEGGIVTDRCRQ